MSTKMADADWSVTLEGFRASLPHRGDECRDDRLLLVAMHYFSLTTSPGARSRRGRQVEQRVETL